MWCEWLSDSGGSGSNNGDGAAAGDNFHSVINDLFLAYQNTCNFLLGPRGKMFSHICS
jgi:hypothetical protein